MASLSQRGKNWTATARLPDAFQGPCKSRSYTATFKKKKDAQLWLDSTESAMRLGTWTDPRLEPKPGTSRGYLDQPLAHAMKDYQSKITPEKKGASQEFAMLNMLMREPFASKTVRELNVTTFVDYRDARRKDKKAASTIRNNLNTISAVFEWLIYEREVDTTNPIAKLRKHRRGVPQPGAGRERRLKAGEEEKIWAQLSGGSWQNRQWAVLFPVLIDTGMRCGEALSILAGWVREQVGFLVIPEPLVKGSENRYVALSDRAYQELLKLAEGEPDDAKVFRFTKNSCEHEWQKIRIAAGCPDLRIHDLRHEALSRMSANGADTKLLMRQSGHKTVAVLMRYLNPTPSEQRDKLFGTASKTEVVAA